MKINRERVEDLRREYPKGTRVKLVHMDDCQAPPVGTEGVVIGVDDIGDILMRWDTGSGLAVIPGIDEIKKMM